MLRRHHCRLCLKPFCYSCSTNYGKSHEVLKEEAWEAKLKEVKGRKEELGGGGGVGGVEGGPGEEILERTQLEWRAEKLFQAWEKKLFCHECKQNLVEFLVDGTGGRDHTEVYTRAETKKRQEVDRMMASFLCLLDTGDQGGAEGGVEGMEEGERVGVEGIGRV